MIFDKILNFVQGAKIESAAVDPNLPSLTLKKTNAQAIADAIEWAKWIVNDNSFHYGYTSKDKKINAHHNGCYFCGTNVDHGGRSKKGVVDYQKTYCCNPFVTAAFAHGACDATVHKKCSSGGSYVNRTFRSTKKVWKTLGKPAFSSLKPGDILYWEKSNAGHYAIYLGNHQLAEAASSDDNKRGSVKWKNSIHIRTIKGWGSFQGAFRYIGSVNRVCNIQHGEVSDRVGLLQKQLGITADRIFGDATLQAVLNFQKEKGLTVDGIVGPKTISAFGTPMPIPEPEKSPAEKILETCKVQAEWMKNYTYKWQANPTVEKSKKYGTCVTYVACVLQRLGYLKPGECIWHTSKGKIYGTNDRMILTYYNGKTIKSLRDKLKAGDVIIVGKKSVTQAGDSGSHIFVFAGEWDGKGNPYIWDNHSATNVKKGKSGKHTYSGSKNVIGVVQTIWKFDK